MNKIVKRLATAAIAGSMAMSMSPVMAFAATPTYETITQGEYEALDAEAQAQYESDGQGGYRKVSSWQLSDQEQYAGVLTGETDAFETDKLFEAVHNYPTSGAGEGEKHSDLSIDGGAGVDPDTRNYGNGTNDDSATIDEIKQDTEVYLHIAKFGDPDEDAQLRVIAPVRIDVVETGDNHAVADTYTAYNNINQRAFFANLGSVDAVISNAEFAPSDQIQWNKNTYDANLAAAETIDDYKALKPYLDGTFKLADKTDGRGVGQDDAAANQGNATIDFGAWSGESNESANAFASWHGEQNAADNPLFVLNKQEELDLTVDGEVAVPSSYQMTTDIPKTVGTITWTITKGA